MLSSLKKWVQDVTVDLTPPPPPPAPPQPSTSSPALSLSSLKPGSGHHYFYSSTVAHDQKHFCEHLQKTSLPNMGLSRPISMDSVPNTKLVKTPIPPPPASPIELDLSHLNREEQEHIANVLRRARAVDEQQTSIPPVAVSSIQSLPTSIVSASFSSLTSSSSSTSTSSFNSEIMEKYEQTEKICNNDENEIPEHREIISPTPESTSVTIYRCQVCNKQQQENIPVCLQCRDDEEEVAQLTQNSSMPIMTMEKSFSPIPIEFNNDEEVKIYDNTTRDNEELVKRDFPTLDNTRHASHHSTIMMNENQSQQKRDDKENQCYQFPDCESKLKLISSTMLFSVKTRTNNLTEIDENDFFYQGPSPYVTTVDNNVTSDQIKESTIPSYQIDEYPDEDDNYERDHVKELEETIANLSRHFPESSQQTNNTEIDAIVTNLQQPSTLSVDKTDIDSILEMEIESPSTDERYIQSTSSTQATSTSTQHPLSIPISIPIITNNRRGSLSRSSGIRENLMDLLVTGKQSTESYPSDTRSLSRTMVNRSKRKIPIHRQKRNLPSVPLTTEHLQLRRTNSESRFCLPAVHSIVLISNSNIDDEFDLLEIDLNDPMGSVNRTSRSKTESEISKNNDLDYHQQIFHTTAELPSLDKLKFAKTRTKQLRDQTTNTPPISSLNSTIKTKKKLKKKGSSSPNHHHASSTYANGQMITTATSPTSPALPNPHAIVLAPLALTTTETTTTSIATTNTIENRPKLQKSTSTEISYPFPVLKLILSRERRNASQNNSTDLGLLITGGHSLAYCMEVSACIERIDKQHKNYNILKNVVQEGDEVLEVGGVSLRGKSALFVKNLMNSIQNEFEIVVRSQHVMPVASSSNEIHKTKSIQSNNSLTVRSNTSLTVESNFQRRHSMDTTQYSQQHLANTPVVKSQSTTMPLVPAKDSNNASDQLHAPILIRNKSVSSKERLFSVESLHRTSSTRSVENYMKAIAPLAERNLNSNDTYNSSEQQRSNSIKREERKQTSLSVTTNSAIDNKTSNDDSIQSNQRRRLYEHRNSLLPNDPGLNGAGINQTIDRRNSNESDESDNLSQYFRSPQSRKSSLMTTNEISTVFNVDSSHEQKQNTASTASDGATVVATKIDATHRLQDFIKTSEEPRQSKDSTSGAFKFLKKKNKSVDFSNQAEIRANDYVGDIELQIGHNSDREQLVIRIIRAKNLLAKDTNGYSDPFVKVYLLPGRDQENKRRTKHVSKSLNPLWDNTVVYSNMHREELQYKMLEFTLWDYDRFKANDFLGQVTIDLKDAKVIDDKPHWYRLQALRSREEATNRGSSPRLFKMTSIDSTGSSASTSNKSTVNMQSRVNRQK